MYKTWSKENIEAATPVQLDITNSENILKCTASCSDINILINNAAVAFKELFISENISKAALLEMKVNYIGLIDMINAFVPILQNADKAAIVNVLSMGALVVVKRLGSYSASKTASHILTETIREELEHQNIKVMAAYMGYVDMAMVPEETSTTKSSPQEIALGICKGINNNENHILSDSITKEFVKNNPIKTTFFD